MLTKEVQVSNPTYNFCAGPAALPRQVLEKAQVELLDWQGLGVSVMEISHRSAEYQAMADAAEANFRELLNIGDEHAVLFLHGGATLQFSNIPMSLLHSGNQAEYLCNGIWSNKAAKEATRFGDIKAINMMEIDADGNRSLLELDKVERLHGAAYTHYTPNETIEGLWYRNIPSSEGALVADLSSCILSEQVDIADFDFIYAGAQKNIGPAGLTIVIVKREMFSRMQFENAPSVFNYEAQAKNGSMINTPATYSWYLAGLVFDWLIEQGGVEAMERAAIEKSQLLYSCIDQDDFYRNPIAVKDRSRMNIPFMLKDDSLNSLFLQEAKENKLVGLEGHRSVGGMRASLYNAIPLDGVASLTEFMKEFKRSYG
ncbi:MAG: 3-phosphoserine/phosphohydroxythreonine transaminase [Kangiellaceae bacterium]|nr:3-phosphoserine/phosphohydroxythreonine transaminase [Kangiellaceae bacterium]